MIFCSSRNARQLLVPLSAASLLLASDGQAQEANLLSNTKPDENARIVYRSADSSLPDAFTIDIFWCSGDDKDASRAMAASELAGSIRIAALVAHEGRFKIGEIRTRSIEQKTFAIGVGNEVATLAKEKALARFNSADIGAENFVETVLPKLSINVTAAPSTGEDPYVPNYISFYVCSNFDPSAYSGRLFFQVQSADQKQHILATADKIQADYRGLSVARGIEIVGDQSPEHSEIRYFFANDAALAGRIAEDISKSTNAKVEPKLVEGYENKVRQGTLEAWIASTP